MGDLLKNKGVFLKGQRMIPYLGRPEKAIVSSAAGRPAATLR